MSISLCRVLAGIGSGCHCSNRNDYVVTRRIRVIIPSNSHLLKMDLSYVHCNRFRKICSVSSDSNLMSCERVGDMRLTLLFLMYAFLIGVVQAAVSSYITVEGHLGRVKVATGNLYEMDHFQLANGFVNRQDREADHEGSAETGGTLRQGSFATDEMLKQLRRYGVAGILSYGLLNTIYYLTTFLLVWFYFAPAPGKMGYFAAVKRFLKVMAMVWAGSQVTKLIRAGGALALAPFVDKGLWWFTEKFNFTSQGKAFFTIVGFCFGLALVLFFVVTLLWA